MLYRYIMRAQPWENNHECDGKRLTWTMKPTSEALWCVRCLITWSHNGYWVEWLWNRRGAGWAIRSALLVPLARSAALIRSLAPELMGTRSLSMIWTRRFFIIWTHSGFRPCAVTLCVSVNARRWKNGGSHLITGITVFISAYMSLSLHSLG